jgi:hypothetical protein
VAARGKGVEGEILTRYARGETTEQFSNITANRSRTNNEIVTGNNKQKY